MLCGEAVNDPGGFGRRVIAEVDWEGPADRCLEYFPGEAILPVHVFGVGHEVVVVLAASSKTGRLRAFSPEVLKARC